MGDREDLGDLVRAGRDMDEVRVPLELAGDVDAVLYIIPAGIDLVADDADLDRVLGPAVLMYAVYYGVGEAGAVFDVPAPSVVSVILLREELRYEPAVAAVDGDHVEAAAFAVERGLRVLLDDLFNFRLVHHLYGRAARRDALDGAVEVEAERVRVI